MPNGLNIGLKKGFQECFLGCFSLFLLFFFWSPSFHTFDVCVYLLQRSKADLCKSAHLSGTGTEKIHTELVFFSLTSFKVETGEDTQLPTRVSFLTRSLFVVCSNVFFFFSLEWDLSLWMYWERKKPDTLKQNKKRKWRTCVNWNIHRLTASIPSLEICSYRLNRASIFQYL